MTLAFLTLGLLCVHPASAQSGYPDSGSGSGSGSGYPGGGSGSGGSGSGSGGGGHWQLDHYECAGADTWTDRVGDHTVPWSAQAANPSLAFGHEYGSPDQSVGTVTGVFTWQGSDQPPGEVFLLISSYADAAGTSFGPTADDGFGDPGTGNSENCSAGKHAVKIDNSNHNTTVKTQPYSLSAICGSSGYTTWVTFQASIDPSKTPRSVTITSTIDPTYHKGDNGAGIPIPVANQPDAYGSIYADSANFWPRTPGPAIKYIPNVIGSWTPASLYNWYGSPTGGSSPGIFTMPDDPPASFFVVYAGLSHGQEHVNLRCTDAGDSMIASGNYYVNWHDEWEPASWPPDGAAYKVMGPDPDAPSWPTYPWKMVTPLDEISFPGQSTNVSYQEAGIESVDGGLELGVDPVKIHFGISGNPSDKFTWTNPLPANPPLGYGQETWAVYREIVARTKGHLDHYRSNGYSGPGVWRHDVMKGIDMNLYTPYQSTSTLAFDPDPAWNPPGHH